MLSLWILQYLCKYSIRHLFINLLLLIEQIFIHVIHIPQSQILFLLFLLLQLLGRKVIVPPPLKPRRDELLLDLPLADLLLILSVQLEQLLRNLFIR